MADKEEILLTDGLCKQDADFLKSFHFLCQELRNFTICNIEFYQRGKSSVHAKFYTAFCILLERTQTVEPLVNEITPYLRCCDFSEEIQANGYRSFVKIVHRCCLHLLQLCRHIHVNKNSLLFRSTSYCRDLEAYVETLGQLIACLRYLLQLITYTQDGELFLQEDHVLADSMLLEVEMLNTDTFYGRCLGLQFCESIRKTLQAVLVVMATFSECYEETSQVMQLATSLFNSSKYIVDQELRARQVVNTTRTADIKFCKAFWSIPDSPILHHLQSFTFPHVEVSEVFSLEPENFELPMAVDDTDEMVTITPPCAYTGPTPVHVRLISHALREGQDVTRKRFQPKTGSKSREVLPKSPSLVFHCHGGGWVSQSSQSHENYLRPWARALKAPILSVDYSLAPDAPFPRALEECFYAYAWALKNPHKLGWTGERVCFAGDSAGANLAMSTALRAVSYEIRVPDGILVTYPVLLVQYTPSPARLMAMIDPLLPVGILTRCLAAYAGISDEFSSALAKPIFCNPGRLEPWEMIDVEEAVDSTNQVDCNISTHNDPSNGCEADVIPTNEINCNRVEDTPRVFNNPIGAVEINQNDVHSNCSNDNRSAEIDTCSSESTAIGTTHETNTKESGLQTSLSIEEIKNKPIAPENQGKISSFFSSLKNGLHVLRSRSVDQNLTLDAVNSDSDFDFINYEDIGSDVDSSHCVKESTDMDTSDSITKEGCEMDGITEGNKLDVSIRCDSIESNHEADVEVFDVSDRDIQAAILESLGVDKGNTVSSDADEMDCINLTAGSKSYVISDDINGVEANSGGGQSVHNDTVNMDTPGNSADSKDETVMYAMCQELLDVTQEDPGIKSTRVSWRRKSDASDCSCHSIEDLVDPDWQFNCEGMVCAENDIVSDIGDVSDSAKADSVTDIGSAKTDNATIDNQAVKTTTGSECCSDVIINGLESDTDVIGKDDLTIVNSIDDTVSNTTDVIGKDDSTIVNSIDDTVSNTTDVIGKDDSTIVNSIDDTVSNTTDVIGKDDSTIVNSIDDTVSNTFRTRHLSVSDNSDSGIHSDTKGYHDNSSGHSEDNLSDSCVKEDEAKDIVAISLVKPKSNSYDSAQISISPLAKKEEQSLNTYDQNDSSTKIGFSRRTVSLIDIPKYDTETSKRTFRTSPDIHSIPSTPLSPQLPQGSRSFTPKMFSVRRKINQSPLQLFRRLPIVRNPYMSPMLAPDDMLMGLPAVHIVACHFDPLLDDSIMFARKLRKLNKPVDLHVVDLLPHGFLNFAATSPEAKQASRVCLSKLAKVLNITLEDEAI